MKSKLICSLLILTLLCSALLSACSKEPAPQELADSIGLAYKATDDGKSCIVTGMGSCTDTEVKIPETIDGLKVMAIGAGAFAKNEELTSVIIPFGVKIIAGSAFLKCPALTSVTIPATTEKIAASAFRDCSSLEAVYYEGTPSDWKDLSIGESNDPLQAASIFYFSENTPQSAGNYWHYVGGAPTKW